jgi:hypothetical protein
MATMAVEYGDKELLIWKTNHYVNSFITTLLVNNLSSIILVLWTPFYIEASILTFTSLITSTCLLVTTIAKGVEGKWWLSFNIVCNLLVVIFAILRLIGGVLWL